MSSGKIFNDKYYMSGEQKEWRMREEMEVEVEQCFNFNEPLQ